ncbi:hypothetical protein sos41_02490 [Alphaproteobacteria bacterium SO-S41]|nr:hypothetical protein sos41_02490 [Alphaproteobacteria bacterium SO-S41]
MADNSHGPGPENRQIENRFLVNAADRPPYTGAGRSAKYFGDGCAELGFAGRSEAVKTSASDAACKSQSSSLGSDTTDDKTTLSARTQTRATTCLSFSQCEGIFAAAGFAYEIGLPLNRLITINWSTMGLSDKEASLATPKFLTRLRDWIRKSGGELAYVWVRENGNEEGSHVHILAHIPTTMTWNSGRSVKWVKEIAARPYRRGAIDTRIIARSKKAASITPRLYEANLGEVVGYICKGGPTIDEDGLVRAAKRNTGRVLGKRAGWSQNIGQNSRERLSAEKASHRKRQVDCRQFSSESVQEVKRDNDPVPQVSGEKAYLQGLSATTLRRVHRSRLLKWAFHPQAP